ncbi:TetR/AcrR family transcriptional regulator [Paractinoplanes durhamensis]|uniref:TetR family transcriptional regulator n=1 Tax=Paractinoplanes durhamensis TaxID=113563 RepID=A0ABQ3YS83_9ACTN|nr:TetR/AcrR family transcriptional regulator [Actinoplanes durhamensis]GIE00403.1 TetR family transcriptional regulator [Actinoplanes durhamensis]
MTTAPLRKDAARNWHRIVEVGRRMVDEGTPIQLNDVARAAEVGVATVYRHFPTPEALLETLAVDGLEALVERAFAAGDPWPALRDLLYAGVDAQITDRALAPVFAAPVDALPRTTELKRRLVGRFGELLGRAHAAGAVDPAVTAADLMPLMCGVIFAAGVHPAATTAERAATARHYLTVLLEGIRRRS